MVYGSRYNPKIHTKIHTKIGTLTSLTPPSHTHTYTSLAPLQVMPGEANQPPSDETAAWSPTSWRSRPIKQQPDYKDPEALE